MKILDFFRKIFRKKLTSVGLEEALEKGLITEEEYHQLIIQRHEIVLKDLMRNKK